MNMLRMFLRFSAVALVLIAFTGLSYGTVVDAARVTIDCGGHAVTVSFIGFTLDGQLVYSDPAPGLACTAGNGDTKLYTFDPALDINDFEFDYICDEGQLTHVIVPSSQFYFHLPLPLVCPSPGGTIELMPGEPVPGGAMLIVSDHDALEWPGSECFQFRGGLYDYTAVTWYCPTDDEPVFHITPGCEDCDPVCVCPPAVFASYGYSAKFSPIPNIWVRVFWPIGLITPGCWCYHFDFQLPVQLASFDAVPAGDDIQIRFATASEQNIDHFEIWRGTQRDGAFDRIGTVGSNGNSTTEQVYTFVDGNVASGTTYWYYLADLDREGHRAEHRDRMVSATPNVTASIPAEYTLSAYPNPFNPTTTIAFTLPIADRVSLKVYDVAGRVVSELAGRNYIAGSHKVTFDASALPSGIYMARIEAGTFMASQKLLLIK
ncbi:T9SS C-terminal target domain-containing protein [candidate division KSB1 bacterium]|nr:MAG: T9SS C-terminal target domain-containing protein [candidate division KSB1 bacterium]